jgi:hypothetical protein
MAFGIDFGTTNSSVAWADSAGQVHSLSVRSGKEPFDAVVRSVVFDPSGQFGDPVVGHRAFEAAAQRANAPLLSSFKFKLDKQRLRESIVQIEYVSTGDYDFVEEGSKVIEKRVERHMYDDHSRKEVVEATGQVLKRLLTSDELSRDPAIQTASVPRGVLGKLLRSLTKTQNEPAAPTGEEFGPKDELIYVGIPVTVGSTARKRMLSALARTEVFGRGPNAYQNVLRRCRFVYEPLAIASTLQLHEAQSVLIFDYGGGSLDLALLDVGFDEVGLTVKERALGGVAVAGDRLDELFREVLLRDDPELRSAYERERGSGSTYDRYRAGTYFTLAKIQLSQSDSTMLRLPGFSRKVRRAEFERAIEPALSTISEAVEDCLRRGGLKAPELGQLVLTGGSSLIPAVQERLRDRFSDLDDTQFLAGRAGDPSTEREALTGVSRGLANYGFVSQFFEGTTPCDYGLWSKHGFVPCLKRGAPAEYELSEAPARRFPISRCGAISFALYSNLVRDAFCGALGDIKIPAGTEAVDIRVAAARRRFVPAFAVYAAGTNEPLGKFDLEGLSAEQLEQFIEGDCEWLPEGDHLMSAFLTRPLQDGDFVEWRSNGRYHRGQVLQIRDVDENVVVNEMEDFDPVAYRVDVALEDGDRAVQLGHRMQCDWKLGDVRLL